MIIDTFNAHKAVDDFSVVLSYEQIAEKNYSFSAGQYFEVKIEYKAITDIEFDSKLSDFQQNLDLLFSSSQKLEKEINDHLSNLHYGFFEKA